MLEDKPGRGRQGIDSNLVEIPKETLGRLGVLDSVTPISRCSHRASHVSGSGFRLSGPLARQFLHTGGFQQCPPSTQHDATFSLSLRQRCAADVIILQDCLYSWCVYLCGKHNRSLRHRYALGQRHRPRKPDLTQPPRSFTLLCGITWTPRGSEAAPSSSTMRPLLYKLERECMSTGHTAPACDMGDHFISGSLVAND